MVGGELDQVAAVQPVCPRVPHVGEHQPVPIVSGHQRRRDHRGAHTPQIHVGAATFPYRPVRLMDRTRKTVGGRLAGELGLQGIDGGSSCDLAAHVPAHPVRHRE